MTMSDPLGDMLTRIRNGQRARQAVVAAPASKHRANVLEVLKREGYIRGYSHEQVRPGVSELKIELKYVDGARRHVGQRGPRRQGGRRGAVSRLLSQGTGNQPCRV